MKNKKIIIYLFALIGLVAVIWGILSVLNSSVSEVPNTDKKEAKQNLYEYAIKNIDKDSEIVDFNVSPNNNFAGVYGVHLLYLKTANDIEYEVGIDNDKVNEDGSFNEEDVYHNFIRVYTEELAKDKLKDIYNNEKIVLSSDDESILYNSTINIHYNEYDTYLEEHYNGGLLLKDYLDKNRDYLLKQFMLLDMGLVNHSDKLIYSLDEKNIEDFYTLYKKVMDKYDNQFKLHVQIYQFDNKTKESSRIILNNEFNKKIVSKEDYLNYIKNYEKYKVVDEDEDNE